MFRKRGLQACLVATALAASGGLLLNCANAQDRGTAPPPAPGVEDAGRQQGAEVLTRGPIHEAFAEPYGQDAEPGVVIPQEPPEPIDELPPDVMPDGANVEWIPGYWAWDEDRDDFIWLSGVWRDVPPGQRWVPGSWVKAQGGYQWTSGFWTSADATDVSYQPAPPASQEQGPNSPAPDDNHFWVPGTWRYQNNDYRWQPGYWAPAYENWVWVPARYVWTPRGVIFCDGYWDYQLARRGVLFSPLYVAGYRYPRYVPQQVVSVGPLLIHLFVRPRYNHYYFGDYYGNGYVNRGIIPWLGVRQYAFYQYDPLFAFYQTGFFNSGGGGFLNRISAWHGYYDRHPNFRPRHTLAESRTFAREHGDRDDHIARQAVLTASLDDARKSSDAGVKFHNVDQPRRAAIQQQAQEVRKLQHQRGQAEIAAEGAVEGQKNSGGKFALPKVERTQPVEALPSRPDAGQHRIDRDLLKSGHDQPGERAQPRVNPGARPDRSTDKPQPDRGPQGNNPADHPSGRRGPVDLGVPDAPEGDQGVHRIPRPSESPQGRSPGGDRGVKERNQSPPQRGKETPPQSRKPQPKPQSKPQPQPKPQPKGETPPKGKPSGAAERGSRGKSPGSGNTVKDRGGKPDRGKGKDT